MARRNRRTSTSTSQITLSAPVEKKAAPKKANLKTVVAPKKKAPIKTKAMVAKSTAKKPTNKVAVKKTDAELIADRIDELNALLDNDKLGQNRKQIIVDEILELQKELIAMNKLEQKVVVATKTETIANRPKGTKTSITASRAFI